jgi:ABC-2 type transport system ATP-binding protein
MTKRLPLLQVENLAKAYGSLQAVHPLSFSLLPGECVAILGPNGAGKTTLIEMLVGLTSPDSGTIEYGGRSFFSHKADILEEIGVQLQESTLYKKYTVRETLQLFASFYRGPTQEEALLTRLNLQEKADTRLEKLSGGQKQRLYLGCALVHNPRLVFLDEPTASLDPQSRRHLWELIQSLKKEGRGILLATHYLDEAEFLADRVLILDQGALIATGTPRELISQYSRESQLDAQLRRVEVETWAHLQAQFPTLKLQCDPAAGWISAAGDPRDLEALLLELLSQCKGNVEAVTLRQSRLEDVFLQLTGRKIRDE